MRGALGEDLGWGAWFRLHWLRYFYGAMALLGDAFVVGQGLTMAPRPLSAPALVVIGTVGALVMVGEWLIYRRLWPRHLLHPGGSRER